MAEYRQLTDEQLAEVCRTGDIPAGVTLSDMAHDFLRLRKAMRADSRRAEQLRKLRWALEGTVRMLDERTQYIDARAKEAIEGEAEVQAAEAAVSERIADWMRAEARGMRERDSELLNIVAEDIRTGVWK